MRLRTDSSEVEGTVCSVNLKTSRITLKKILDASNNTPIGGVVHFYAEDISSCVVLENSSQKRVSTTREEDGPRLLRIRPVPAHLEQLSQFSNTGEFICHRFDSDDPEDDIKKGYIKLRGEADKLPQMKFPLPKEFHVVDEMDEAFHEAINSLKKASQLGLGYDGLKIGRDGCLSVLVVATEEKVFLFDILMLKNDAFDQGLKDILESKEVEKIVHDCRQICDCLQHLFQVTLDNIFDTEVADILVFRDQPYKDAGGRGNAPTFVRGLQHCLRIFLGMSHDQLKYTRCRQDAQEENLLGWRQRPMSLRQIDGLVKDVVYLRELRSACLDRLLRSFHSGVRYFQTVVRNSSEQELEYLPPEHIVPQGIYRALRTLPQGQGHFHNSSAENGYCNNLHWQNRGDNRRRWSEPWDKPRRRDSYHGYDGYEGGSRFHGGQGQRHRGEQARWNRKETASYDDTEGVIGPGDSLLMAMPAPHLDVDIRPGDDHKVPAGAGLQDALLVSGNKEPSPPSSEESSWEAANRSSSRMSNNGRQLKFLPAGMIVP